MLRVVVAGTTAIAAAVPVLTGRIHAVSGEEPGRKITQLSMYDNPECGVELVPEQISTYRQGISDIRKTVFDQLAKHETKIERAGQIWTTSCAHTQDLVERILENKEKSAIIAASGVMGVLLARGRYVRGMLYGTGGALVAAALCFPRETVDMATAAGVRLKSKITGSGKENDGKR